MGLVRHGCDVGGGQGGAGGGGGGGHGHVAWLGLGEGGAAEGLLLRGILLLLLGWVLLLRHWWGDILGRYAGAGGHVLPALAIVAAFLEEDEED